ncbi:MAG: hypothetical protein EOO65_01640, partial [Methanosarcinales archaeon]
MYPLCDFDKKNNRYKGYATVVTADGSTPPAFEYPMDGDALSGNAYSKHVLFSDERFLFSQPRTEGAYMRNQMRYDARARSDWRHGGCADPLTPVPAFHINVQVVTGSRDQVWVP